MKRLKSCAAASLIGGLLLAAGTPAYVAFTAPSLAGYLLHPVLFLLQALPYGLCAVFWLPWRAAAAARIAFGLSLLLLVAAGIVYIPMLIQPGARGGDMIALAFVGISVVTTLALLAISLVAFIVTRRELLGRTG